MTDRDELLDEHNRLTEIGVRIADLREQGAETIRFDEEEMPLPVAEELVYVLLYENEEALVKAYVEEELNPGQGEEEEPKVDEVEADLLQADIEVPDA